MTERTETLEERNDMRGSSKLTRAGNLYTWQAETRNSTFDVEFKVSGHTVEVTSYTITRTVGDVEYRQSGDRESVDVALLLTRALRHVVIDPSAYRKLGEEGETLASVIGSKGSKGSSNGANTPNKAETDVLRASARVVPGYRLTGATWYDVACAVAGHPVAAQMAMAALGTDRWDTLQRAAIVAAEAAEAKGE